MKRIIPLLISTVLLFSCQSTGFLMAKAKITMINEPYPAKEENANIEVYIALKSSFNSRKRFQSTFQDVG